MARLIHAHINTYVYTIVTPQLEPSLRPPFTRTPLPLPLAPCAQLSSLCIDVHALALIATL